MIFIEQQELTGEKKKNNAPLATEKNDVKLNLCVNPTENTRHSARQKRGKQSVALKTNKFQHCHAIHSSWMCFTELPSLWCLWTRTANSKYRMYSTEVQFIYCIFNLFVERSHCETQPSAKQSKAKQNILKNKSFCCRYSSTLQESVPFSNAFWKTTFIEINTSSGKTPTSWIRLGITREKMDHYLLKCDCLGESSTFCE